MSALAYLDAATKTTLHQCFTGFVFVFVAALLLNAIGHGLRRILSQRLGRGLDFFLLPGSMCHELGRTLGCLLAGVGVDKFEIFNLSVDDSQRIPVAVGQNKKCAFLRRFLILTGPIWLTSAVVCAIAAVAVGTEVFPTYSECFQDGEDVGFLSYVSAVGWGALRMVMRLFVVWHWTSPFSLLVFYVLFCIGSQIKMSVNSLVLIWQSVIGMFCLLFVLNSIPGVNTAIEWIGDKCSSVLFEFHVILAFVVLLNFSFYLILRLIFGKGRRGSFDGEHSKPQGPSLLLRTK